MPQKPTAAQPQDQTVRTLPDGPLSRTQIYRRRRLAKELGVPVDQIPDRRGRHGNHARGKSNGRWNAEARMTSEHGYTLVRVGTGHPLAFGSGYAYEHLLVWVAAGRPLPGPDELIHHEDEDKTNNRLDNLKLKTRSEHAKLHDSSRGRDDLGRFPAPRKAVAP